MEPSYDSLFEEVENILLEYVGETRGFWSGVMGKTEFQNRTNSTANEITEMLLDIYNQGVDTLA